MPNYLVEPEKPQITIWWRVALGLVRLHTRKHTPATVHPQLQLHTHTQKYDICSTYCFSMAEVVSWTRLNVALYAYWLCSSVVCHVHSAFRLVLSSVLLRCVRCFENNVSALLISPIFKGQDVIEDLFLEHPNSWRWDWYVGPKRRFQTTSLRVITQKTEEFSSTAAEAYGLA